jgi:hypothetical protein
MTAIRALEKADERSEKTANSMLLLHEGMDKLLTETGDDLMPSECVLYVYP